MMLYLDVINIPKEDDEHPYFYRTQVEKIKAVQNFLADNISENYTQEELSKKFDFPQHGIHDSGKISSASG